LILSAALNFTVVKDAVPQLLHGALVSVQVTAFAIVGSLIIGITGAALRTSKIAAARTVASAFTEVFRNTPPLVHMLFAFFALPQLGIRLTSFLAGSIALSLYQGAIAIEIFRAGLEAVPIGQVEAGSALGLNRFLQLRYIIVPQGFRICLPALGNNLISTFKNSSLVYAIGLLDITGVAMDQIAIVLVSAEFFIVLGVFYLLGSWLIAGVVRMLELRLARYGA